MSWSLPVLLLFSSFFLSVQASTFTQVYGRVDNFSTTDGVEWMNRTSSLGVCTGPYDWRNIPYSNNVNGDGSVMIEPWFDEKGQDSPVVWSVTNLPTDKPISNIVIEMRLLTKYLGNNDGLGFFWDDNVQSSKPNCRVQYFRRFTTISSTWNDWRTETLVWRVPAGELISATKTFHQKIQENGYFHMLVGDDTSVDYLKFTFDYEDTPANILSFSCKNYTSFGSVTTSARIYIDDTTYTISSINDRGAIPFSGSSLISTSFSDRVLTNSLFQMEIKSSTRFFVFLPSTSAISWLTLGGWELVTGSTVTVTKGTSSFTFNVYSKVYENPRWVVFGSPSGLSLTYFVSFTSAPSVAPVPVNPAARCDCSSTGDPHYITWDNRRFDFYEPGVFHLVKSRDCSFDVQTLTFKYGTTVTVNGIVSVRYLNNTVTLARREGAPGALWTDNATVRLNGVTISSSTSLGGLVVTLNSGQWDISIPEVGLLVKTVVSGNWFHVYPTLSGVTYQRRVDGLCGNCDANPSNDFKFPSCVNAINKTTQKLTANEVAQWGVSWRVSSNEEVASSSVLTSTNRGTIAYGACLASPILRQCSDLVIPEPPRIIGTITQNISEPLPPSTFGSCSGTNVIPVVDPPIPPVPTPQPTPRLCTERSTYSSIKSRCDFCQATAGTPSDNCIVDLCESGENPLTFQCPGITNCLNQTDTTRNITITSGGVSIVYASLGGGSVTATPSTVYCQPSSFRLPPGWDIAPNDPSSRDVITSNPWEVGCVALADGSSLPSEWGIGQSVCPTGSSWVKTSDGCYTANFCNLRLLIRRTPPQCGNGVVEGTEQCDDKNTANGDGCSSTCRLESTNDWSCDLKVSPTVCYPVSNVVIEPEFHVCTINNSGCKGCLITADNIQLKTCCECSVPCCP